jgi:hypothetical protein
MVLKAEEDIRKLAGRTRLLISGSDGVQYRIPDTSQLDKHSRKLLERFCKRLLFASGAKLVFQGPFVGPFVLRWKCL